MRWKSLFLFLSCVEHLSVDGMEFWLYDGGVLGVALHVSDISFHHIEIVQETIPVLFFLQLKGYLSVCA